MSYNRRKENIQRFKHSFLKPIEKDIMKQKYKRSKYKFNWQEYIDLDN